MLNKTLLIWFCLARRLGPAVHGSLRLTQAGRAEAASSRRRGFAGFFGPGVGGGGSIEFFVWLDDERQQCYELADNGIIDEEKMEKLFDDYAKFVRGNSEYKAGKVNKVQFDFDPTKDV